MSLRFPALKRLTWPQWLLLLFLVGNCIALLVGLFVVPAALSSPVTWGALLVDMGLEVVLGMLALIGPFAFTHFPRTMGITVICGLLFAAAYLGLLGCEIAGIHLSFDTGPGTVYTIFIGVGLLASVIACLRTRQLKETVIAGCWSLVSGTAFWSLGVLITNYALWGSPAWHQYWVGDGALQDFQQSGETDLGAFLLRDLWGAIFWHPVLSAVIGIVAGIVGYGIGRLVLSARQLFGSKAPAPLE